MNEASPPPRRVERVLVGDLQEAAAVASAAVERGAVSVTIGEERCPEGAARVVIIWAAGAGQVSPAGTGEARSPTLDPRSGAPRSVRGE